MATEIKDIVYYKRCFVHLNRSSRKGEKAPHKPILLLAVIDRVESLISMGIAGGRMINQNLIDLNPKLEQFFYKQWNTYVTSEVFSPSFSTPFYHMEAEPFWELVLKKNAVPEGGQNESNLYKYYNGAKIDEDLMLLLLEEDSREELRQTLIQMLQSSNPELPLEEEPAFDSQPEEKSEGQSTAFWDYFVKYQNEHDGLYKGCPVSRSESVSRYSSGAHVTSLLFDKKVRVEVYWAKWEDARNKEIFDSIASHKQQIESQIGIALDWQRLDDKRACRISITKPYSYKNTADHQPIAELFTSYSTKLWQVIVPYFQNLPGTTSSVTPQPGSVLQDDMCKLFQDFMRQNGTSERSIKKYSTQVANNADVCAIVKRITGNGSLFQVKSSDQASKVRTEVKASPCDIKGNHMYSAGIAHYIRFLTTLENKTTKQSTEPTKDIKEKVVGWSDEEFILVLDLYFRLPYHLRTRRHSEVIELANLLGRTPGSIVLRMANYLCFDVDEQKLGHKGMAGGERLCRPFWNKYVNSKEQLHEEAEEIRKRLYERKGTASKQSIEKTVLFDHAVDYSFFNYGCTLDKKFHLIIFDVLGGRIERGNKKDISLLFDGMEFSAQFENVDRHGVPSDTVRLMWKGRIAHKLSTYLQQKFPEYKAIAELHEKKLPVPEHLLHKASFSYSNNQFVLEIE